MLEFDFDALSGLGLTPALAGRAAALYGTLGAADGEAFHLSRVTEVHRETVVLHDGRDERSARTLPRLVRALMEEGTALAVGDWAVASVDRHAQCWVTQRVPPASHIARRDADGRRHPVVSNVDIALLVMGLDDDFNPRRLERAASIRRPRDRSTGCPAGRASSIRRGCARCDRTATRPRSRRPLPTSTHSLRDAASTIAGTASNPAARCARALTPTACETTRSCFAKCAATRKRRSNGSDRWRSSRCAGGR